MAGEKASYDRDSSYNLINPFTGQEVKSVPDAELETAYYDQKEITGTEKHSDPYENGDEVYNGKEKDTTRIADKRDHLGDAVKKGHMKKISESKKFANVKPVKTRSINPATGDQLISSQDRLGKRVGGSAHAHAAAQAARGYAPGRNRALPTRAAQAVGSGVTNVRSARLVREAENPMVATSPATSDSPMLGLNGLNAVNTNNSNGAKYNVRSILESIALQAAETFEALDENMNVPDSFASQLDQCSKALNEIYTFVTQNQQGNSQDMSTAVNPVPGKTFMTKENVINEDEHMKEAFVLNPHRRSVVQSYRQNAQIYDSQGLTAHAAHHERMADGLENGSLTPDDAHRHTLEFNRTRNAINASRETRLNTPDYNPMKESADEKTTYGSRTKPVGRKSPEQLKREAEKRSEAAKQRRDLENAAWASAAKAKEEKEDLATEQNLSDKQKRIASLAGNPEKIEADDLAALRAMKKAKDKMEEAAIGVFRHLVKRDW